MNTKIEIDPTKLPNHVAIICDGNRRWARQNGLADLQGHKKGFESVFQLGKDIRKLGIKHLTYWMFSTENWNRSKVEIDYLMHLAVARINKVGQELIKDKVRFIHIGRKDRLPEKLIKKFQELENKTKSFTDYYLYVAMDHGGRDELLRGIQKIIEDKLDPQLITENIISSYLDTKEMPEVDLLIRTSGEHRTSGFLTWKSTYAELAFPKIHLPDFHIKEFLEILSDYQNRDRRFGGDTKKENQDYKLVSKV